MWYFVTGFKKKRTFVFSKAMVLQRLSIICSFSWSNSIPLFDCIMFLSFYPSLGALMGICPHAAGIVNNECCCAHPSPVSGQTYTSGLFGRYLWVGLLDHMLIPWLTLWGPDKHFSWEAMPLHIPTSNIWELCLLHILSDVFTQSVQLWGWYHTAVLICRSLRIGHIKYSFVGWLIICTLLGRTIVQILYSLKKLNYWSFYY